MDAQDGRWRPSLDRDLIGGFLQMRSPNSWRAVPESGGDVVEGSDDDVVRQVHLVVEKPVAGDPEADVLVEPESAVAPVRPEHVRVERASALDKLAHQCTPDALTLHGVIDRHPAEAHGLLARRQGRPLDEIRDDAHNIRGVCDRSEVPRTGKCVLARRRLLERAAGAKNPRAQGDDLLE